MEILKEKIIEKINYFEKQNNAYIKNISFNLNAKDICKIKDEINSKQPVLLTQGIADPSVTQRNIFNVNGVQIEFIEDNTKPDL